MSTLQQEYEEGMQALGGPRMKFYKCLSLFSFENGNEVHFGQNIACYIHERDKYEQLKEYVKEQKKWVRSPDEAAQDPTALSYRLWWFCQKLLEYSSFTSAEFRTILQWVEFCF
jgi:hypothetical protein